jgi:hypothetical protein
MYGTYFYKKKYIKNIFIRFFYIETLKLFKNILKKY